jgi:hypothetical protein
MEINKYQQKILQALQSKKIYQGIPTPRANPITLTDNEVKRVEKTLEIYFRNLKAYKATQGEHDFEISDEEKQTYKDISIISAINVAQKEYNKDLQAMQKAKSKITKRRAKNKVAKASRKANRAN